MFSKYCVKAFIQVSLAAINPLQAAINLLLADIPISLAVINPLQAVINVLLTVIPTSQPVIHHNNL